MPKERALLLFRLQRGRPSKAEKAKEAAKEKALESALEDDMSRILTIVKS